MSDEEEVMTSEEEDVAEEEEETKSDVEDDSKEVAPPEPTGPSEAERAMQKRQAAAAYGNLAEDAQELLASNKLERDDMAREIAELRKRSEQRKKEREQEEKRMAAKRAEEEKARKAEEEERRRKKEEEESSRKAKRAEKMAEFEKWKNPQKPNFVITKRAAGEADDSAGTDETKEKISREQLEAEKRAILAQRTPKLEISGFDAGKLADKAKELHTLIYRLESEKYDLEKRFKSQQYDMMELAERARQMNQVGRGGLKRISMVQNDDVDKMQEQFAGCPSKIAMYSRFERQKDKRSYQERQKLYTGAQYLYPAEKIKPHRKLIWSEDGLPSYVTMDGEPCNGPETPAQE